MTLDPFAPIRLGVRAGIGLLRFELRVVEHLFGLDHERPAPVDFAPEPPITAEPMPEWQDPEPEPIEATPATPVRVAPEPAPRITVEPDEPEHVDVEAELVGEFAEPGAEDGAGAEVHVDEPWPGYRQMRVADIRDRVALANPAELAIVQLYESGNRERKSILEAVDRRSKELANAPS